jgi:DNA-binding MarR family transcriptional regulator
LQDESGRIIHAGLSEGKANSQTIGGKVPVLILRFDELFPDRDNFLAMEPSDVELVQRCYPQIYLACHKRHIRASSTTFRLSSRDSSILAHLSQTVPIAPTALAAHLSVQSSTLSAAIHRLEQLGYLQRKKMPPDRRNVALTLTPLGAKAMADTSVLDSGRVSAVLARLTRVEKKQALKGLELLAKASRQTMNPTD